MANDLTGYLGSSQLPANPYKEGLGYGLEYRQYKGDTAMNQYNQQVHEAELIKQRSWALEDRDYNAPAALKERLREAGYNPALMSGAIQTANQQVRPSSANSPSGPASNMSGHASATQQNIGNLLQAGQNLVTNMMSQKQMQALDADINLKNTQSVKTMADSANTQQQTGFAKELFSTQKDALMQALKQSFLDYNVKDKYYKEQMPAEIQNIQQNTKLSQQEVLNKQAQVKNIYSEITQRGIQNKVSEANINQINAEVTRILNENSTFNKNREEDRKQLTYELQQLELKMRKSGFNPNSTSIIGELKNTIYSLSR